MNDRQHRTVEAFTRSDIYFDQHPIDPEPPLLARLRAELRGVVTSTAQATQAQMAAEREMTAQVERRKEQLRRERMMVLARLCGKYLRNTPEELVLKVPHKSANAGEVAEAALRLADAMEPHRDYIVEAGKPADFLDQMRREAHELQLSARRSGTARNRRSQATRDIADAIAKGMGILDQLEGLVMAHHGADRRKVEYWRRWRRVSKKKGRPRERGKQ